MKKRSISGAQHTGNQHQSRGTFYSLKATCQDSGIFIEAHFQTLTFSTL